MTVTGMKELEQRFTVMETAFQAHEVREIVNFALQEVVDMAKFNAPVLTGTLRDSINWIMMSDYAGEASVGVPYGAAQENGFITKNGNRVAGKHYFLPAAMRGQEILVDELRKYIAANTSGKLTAPPHGRQGGGSGAHKYLQRQATGAGNRYIYGPKRYTTTKRKFQGLPGGKKQPTTKFQARKPGGGSRTRRG